MNLFKSSGPVPTLTGGGAPTKQQLAVCRRPVRSVAARFSREEHHTSERVLRYADAPIRVLRYPIWEEVAEEYLDDIGTSEDEDEAEYLLWDECELPGSACNAMLMPQPISAGSSSTASAPAPTLSPHKQEQQMLAPGHGVEHLQIDEQLQESVDQALLRGAADAWSRVRQSYQVLHGCPWLHHRPMYVVATQAAGTDNAEMYTLRTRVASNERDDELAAVLGRADLASRMSSSRMKDGIVAFDVAEDADRYAALVETESEGLEVGFLEVDSHELFVLADDVHGVVVHVPAVADGVLPLPFQLAAVLQGNNSYAEWQ